MKTDPTYHIDLITRYFIGESTPEDIQNLEDWVKSDPANGEIFRDYSRAWKAVEASRLEYSLNTDQEWNILKAKLATKLQESKTETQNLKPEARNLKPETRNLKPEILTWSLRIAAGLLLLLIPAFLIYRSLSSQNDVQIAASDAISEYTLPDGTKVTLNKGATITYPSEFTGTTRKISLTGEGWFEVTHDAAHPFVIDAGTAMIEVLGTSFSVNTNSSGNHEEVILQTGKVKVFLGDEPTVQVILAPGEKASIASNARSIVKMVNEDENFLAWKTKRMVFSNTALNEVVALLSEVYDVNIRISDNRISECKITATFDQQSLESVLNVLKATLDLQIGKTGNAIEISGAGCK
jgi:ferric-dicitrate binding protein FerR (iron transport regulator)